MEKYLVFEDAKGNPIGLPNKVNDTTEADAILEYVPDDCCYHGVYTKEYLISQDMFDEEDFHEDDD